jgi:ParB-like chromosome segregation protein Spo0J
MEFAMNSTSINDAKVAIANAISVSTAKHTVDLIEEVKEVLHEISPQSNAPVDRVRWVPLEEVEPNDYNPNSVAKVEMGLLFKSIDKDGYTQPVVTIRDEEKGKYVIVDGFHRYFTMRRSSKIRERCNGLLPIVVIKKDINERMAATVRHNRARGKHSVDGMANMVFQMLENGMSDADICNELGMEAEELVRLKHITGFSKLFKDVAYNKAWVNENQIKIKMKRKKEEADAIR